MKKQLLAIILMSTFITGCQTTSGGGVSIWMQKDENTKSKDYSYINDPTGSAPKNKVHSFQISSECGDIKRNSKNASKHIGKWHDSDCGENSVRSEIGENVWDDHRPGEKQPKEAWYRWNVFLPKDYPIQEGGKLHLGQFHNGECPHVSFTSTDDDNGKLYFETMKTWQGDCKDTKRIPFTSIQELRGKWIEFVMFSRWSNKADGKFQIYINGKLAMDWNGRTLTKGKESRNFVKVGIYQCCNKDNPIKPASALFTTPERSSKSFLPK